MQNRKQLSLLACMALILLASQTLWGQFVIQVNGTDGSGITDTLTLAVDPAGTASFDSLSPSLREYEIPVAAKGLDFRVASNFPADVIGLGSYTSIHLMTFPTQTDKWKMQFNVDSGRTDIMLQWPAGLGSVGGGVWKIIPDENDVITFSEVDMTTSTSLSIPVTDIEPHTFYIVTGDGQKYRSFTANEIATAVDSKLKAGKSEKRKPYRSEGTYTLTNSTSPPSAKYDVHIEWSQLINDATISITPTPTSRAWADAPKNTKLDLTYSGADSLLDGATITIYAEGNKGKQLQIKKYWWTRGVGIIDPPKIKFGLVLPEGGGVLRLQMPNINNIGEEIYTQGIYPPGPIPAPWGLTIGDPANRSGVNVKLKDVFKAVVHPKWKDVVKTLVDKTGQQTGPAACLDEFAPIDGLKPIEKPQKSLPPGKHSNRLLGAAVALKVNIGAGDGGKIEEGGTVFGDLRYVRQVGDPIIPAGTTVRAIAESLDNVMRCHPSTWDSAGLSTSPAGYEAWYNAVSRINASFSGPFDTTSFGQTSGGKPAGGTIARGTAAIMDVPYLYRTSFANNVPDFRAADIQTLEARNQPAVYRLMQNYPNPFNPTTTIEFALPQDGMVTLKVYNLLGQEVASLIDNQMMDEGTNEVSFDASSLSSGVYFYRLIAQGVDEDGVVGATVTKVMKMMLVK
jgi:hypothetical protein